MRRAVPLFLLVIATAAVLAPGNRASRPLNAHEILAAQTATEMQERGEYLVPYYNGMVRLEKPPLQYWLAIAAHRAFGRAESTRVEELEARMPSLVAGVLLLFVVFQLGAIAFDDARVGLVASAILATTSHYFIFSRSARPEMIYALLCTLQMLGLMIAIRRSERGLSSFGGAALAWVSTAAALLAKGPQLPAFFVIGASAAILLRRPRLSPGRALHLWVGLAFLAVAVIPYFAYLASQSEGALTFWAGQVVQGKEVPLWLRPLRLYYPAMVIVGFSPWIVPLFAAGRDVLQRRHPSSLVLASCVLVAVLGLSFAGKLREHYVLPTIPLCAVLAGAALVHLRERARESADAADAVRKLLVAQGVATAIALLVAAFLSFRVNPVSGARPWLQVAPFLTAGALLARAALREAGKRPDAAFAALVGSLITGWGAVAVGGIDASPRWVAAARFAEEVARESRPEDPLFLESGIEESLVYYGRRRVVWSSVRDWMAANPSGRPPLFVCELRCAESEGRIIIEQRDALRDPPMVLFRPHRPPSAPTSDSESASPALGEARP